jgi:hypothetical protein
VRRATHPLARATHVFGIINGMARSSLDHPLSGVVNRDSPDETQT